MPKKLHPDLENYMQEVLCDVQTKRFSKKRLQKYLIDDIQDETAQLHHLLSLLLKLNAE